MRSAEEWLKWYEQNLITALECSSDEKAVNAVMESQHGQPRVLFDVQKEPNLRHQGHGAPDSDLNGAASGVSIKFGVMDELGQSMYPQKKLIHMEQEGRTLHYTVDLSDLPADAMYLKIKCEFGKEPAGIKHRRAGPDGMMPPRR